MSQADNLLITTTNVVASAPSITSNFESSTDLNWIKNSARARQTRWTNPDGDIEITIFFDDFQKISYFCIAGHDLPDNAQVRFQLQPDEGAALYDSGFQDVASLVPAGEFEAGSTPYNTTVSVLQNIFFKTFDVVSGVASIDVSIRHNYVYEVPTATTETTAQTTTETTTVSDGRFRQSDDGVFSVECENMVRRAAGSDAFIEVSDPTGSSNGKNVYKNGGQFYNNALTGPRLTTEFTATQSGSHRMYVRLKSTDGNSLYSTFDGQNQTHVLVPYSTITDGSYRWIELQTVNVVAGNVHEIILSARDHYLTLDKLILIPVSDPVPADNSFGPDESDFGTITTTTTTTSEGAVTVFQTNFQNFVNLRMILAGEHTQLYENFEHGASISFLTDTTNYRTESGYLITGKTQKEVRSMSLDLSVMELRDRRVMIEHEKNSRNSPFIISAYPNVGGLITEQHQYLCKFDSKLSYGHNLPNIYGTNLVLTEV